MNSLKMHVSTAPVVATALSKGSPVLAMESTIIAHGMPYPDNFTFAQKAHELARKYGVVPATIAIIKGMIYIGLEDHQLKILSNSKRVEKIATRDIAFAISNKLTGATTVSATMHLAHLAGIDVFATGGIGGVHRNAEATFDISQDLIELSRTPMVVVSAGVKAILDISKTLEYLETSAVPVVGYGTHEFPAFYSRLSGNYLSASCNTPEEVADIFVVHRNLGLKSAVLVANPAPKSDEIPRDIIDKYIAVVLKKCAEKKVVGKQVTPFLLKNIVAQSSGESLRANIALALNNVLLGAQIAKKLSA